MPGTMSAIMDFLTLSSDYRLSLMTIPSEMAHSSLRVNFSQEATQLALLRVFANVLSFITIFTRSHELAFVARNRIFLKKNVNTTQVSFGSLIY
jgi:hypothetical protein